MGIKREDREKEIFSFVLSKAPYGAVLVGEDGCFNYMNEEFVNITGYTADDVPNGRTWFEKAYPDKKYRKKVIRAWKSDITRKGVSQIFTILCKNGDTKEIEFRPSSMDNGRYLVMISDVTKKRQAEESLQRAHDNLEVRIRERTEELVKANRTLHAEIVEKEQYELSLFARDGQLSAIIDAIDGLIYVCSQDYHIEFMNDRLMKLRGGNGTGKLCYEVLHGRESICPWCVNESVFKGETVRWELLSPKDGRWYYIVNTPIYNRDGTMSKHAIIFDITERKEAENEIRTLNEELQARVKELRRTNRDLEMFNYSISHDLRSPLTAIEGFSRRLLLKCGNQFDGKGEQLLKIINRSARQMRELVEDLLSFSRLGRQKVRPLSIDMGAIAREAVDQLKTTDPGWDADMIFYPLPVAIGDRIMIKQVFVNLIGNAVKYRKPEGKPVIEIGGYVDGGRNVYYVKDNGIGFPMEQAERLFEAFERLHSSTEFEGTGVGLAIVKRIVERHSGEVWAEGKVGEGATFHFSLAWNEQVAEQKKTVVAPTGRGRASE